MLSAFTIAPVPSIIFGTGKISQLPNLAATHGKNILFLVGGYSFTATDQSSRLWQEVVSRGLKYHVERIAGEPSPTMIDDIAQRYRQRGIDCVVAIGGGSVLDGGKAVAAMLKATGGVKEYLEGVGSREPDGCKVPFIAVPTTAGTGSEVTSNAVISSVGRTGFKKSLRHAGYIPDIALVDPDLAANCPLGLTATCGMDAFSQLVESYLSTKASVFTDDLALGGIKLMAPILAALGKEGMSTEVRSRMADMSYGAMVSGITLTNAGLGAVHGMASVIGGLYDIPHGVVCGTLMAKANEVTLRRLRRLEEKSPGLEKYTELGRQLGGEEKKGALYLQDAFIACLHELSASLPLGRLGDYGVVSNDIDVIAERCGSKNNPISLGREDFEEILLSRL